MLLHIRQIPATHSLFPTAHFCVEKHAILGPGAVLYVNWICAF